MAQTIVKCLTMFIPPLVYSSTCLIIPTDGKLEFPIREGMNCCTDLPQIPTESDLPLQKIHAGQNSGMNHPH